LQNIDADLNYCIPGAEILKVIKDQPDLARRANSFLNCDGSKSWILIAVKFLGKY